MSTYTVTGPLRYCRCGHGEHEHSGWLHECPINGCTCERYVRDRNRRHSIESAPTDPKEAKP